MQNAIHVIETEPYTTALYDASEILVEAGWDQAKALLDIETGRHGFDVVPQWVLAKLQGYSKQLSFLVVDRERDVLKQDLELSIANGEGIRELTARIAESFAQGYHVVKDGEVTRKTNVDTWSRMVARTEMTRAQTMGAMALYRTAGIEKVQWSASLSNICCDACSDADGEVEPIGTDFAEVDVDSPPAHPNCCPAGTRVVLARGVVSIEEVVVGDLALTHTGAFRRVRAVMSREVSEELVDLRVAGRRLTLTRNHPVRTPNGWTAADALQPGDEVCCVGSEAMLGSTLDADEVPPVCFECALLRLVLDALTWRLMPVSSVDFDRELPIGESDIDARCANHKVWFDSESAIAQRVEDDALVARLDSTGSYGSTTGNFVSSSFTTTNGRVSGIGQGHLGFGRKAVDPKLLGFGNAANRQTETPHAFRKSGSIMGIAERPGNIDQAFASNVTIVKRAKFGVGEAFSHTHILPINARARLFFSGKVYNFAVETDESYVAEGIVVHNCACALVAADDDLGAPDASDEDRKTAARGGYSAEEYQRQFGHVHPVDEEDDE